MPSNPAVPSGERIYAIGDVHGRLDLLGEILAMIRIDGKARGPAEVKLILLGDVIDRGPSSADIVRRLMSYTASSDRMIVLKGNHEVAMAAGLDGNYNILGHWLDMGGDATLASWGVAEDLIGRRALAAVLRSARILVTPAVLSWIDALPLFHRSGDYFFVHAGIRPGLALSDQDEDDLLWIGDEFLESEVDHPAMIVHGHTIVEAGPEIHRNRIALDTGAYRTGRLSAVCFEGSRQWTIVTGGATQRPRELAMRDCQ